jgi:hypothetical protein
MASEITRISEQMLHRVIFMHNGYRRATITSNVSCWVPMVGETVRFAPVEHIEYHVTSRDFTIGDGEIVYTLQIHRT